jgi:acyl carrier protein/GNAT superfamily N-acetyltransferase
VDISDIRRAIEATIESVAPGTDPPRLRPDVPLREQIDLDSLDWLNVIAGLQDRLSVEIPEADYERLSTLDAIVGYVATAQARCPSGPSPGAAAGPGPLPRTVHRVDGEPVALRPMQPDDLPLEADFVRHLSADTRYERFMVTLRELSPAKLKYLTDVDQVRHVALVATVQRSGQEVLVGVARYIVDPAGDGCEFAIAVDDAWQGRAVAGILMHALMGVARSRGLATMTGFVLAANTRMLRFARRLGFALRHDPGDRDTVRVVRPL